ncbi:MAG: DUF4007 family protein [Deltaproteobacteria bacterium]|nr:DUF4007 family protein [Deltaproteobacteria bacterium]
MNVIETPSFSGHETFPFRYAWLPKAVRGTSDDPGIFGREDAMVEFGVGKNMVTSIRHWALACGILEQDPSDANNRGRQLVPTDLGRRLFAKDGWDPYLEDPGTLWLLHWQLATGSHKATTWSWTFNHAPSLDFTRAELSRWLRTLAERKGWKRLTANTLKRDVEVFVRSYVPGRVSKRRHVEDTLDCPLVELGLIREGSEQGVLHITRGSQPSLPNEIFAACLSEFLKASDHGHSALPVQAIGFEPGAPGQVFCLGEEALLARLESLSQITKAAIRFDETAGLRTLLFAPPLPTKLDLLESYYAQANRSAS